MKQINNEQFGKFLTKLRKEKQLTQKELAEQLYVSDKTISKWERGMGMPNVTLLLPIAEVFGITVTELLRGARMDQEKMMEAAEVEALVRDSLDLSQNYQNHQQKKKWRWCYLLCLIMTGIEIAILFSFGITVEEMKETILLVSGLFLTVGGWFTLFAKEQLPVYYDQNNIHFISQGFCRIHMPGLSFHNGNWPYLLRAFRIWSLAVSILYPMLAIFVISLFPFTIWNQIQSYILVVLLGCMVVSIYAIGKYYE